MLKRLMVVVFASMFSAGVSAAIEAVQESTAGIDAATEHVNAIPDEALVRDQMGMDKVVKQARENYARYLQAGKEGARILVKLHASPEKQTAEKSKLLTAFKSNILLQKKYLEAYMSDMAAQRACLEVLLARNILIRGYIMQFMAQRLSLIGEHLNKIKTIEMNIVKVKREVLCKQ